MCIPLRKQEYLISRNLTTPKLKALLELPVKDLVFMFITKTYKHTDGVAI